jgi:hypothetical protein
MTTQILLIYIYSQFYGLVAEGVEEKRPRYDVFCYLIHWISNAEYQRHNVASYGDVTCYYLGQGSIGMSNPRRGLHTLILAL